jgi:HKD family nuclease
MISAFKREKHYLEYFDDEYFDDDSFDNDSFDNIILTTFEYDRGFIEDTLLSRLTGKGKIKDLNDRIELEDALKSKSITIISSPISNELKTLYGYDLIPYPGVQHSKIAVLSKPDLVRFIVGSVNLTEDAFCKNREAFIVLDYMRECEYPASLAESILDYLSRISGERGRIKEQVAEINRRLSLMKLSSKGAKGSPTVNFIAQSNTGENTVYTQVMDSLGSEKINGVKVMTPFFEDKDGSFLSSFINSAIKRKAKAIDIYFPSLSEAFGNKWQMPAHSSVVEALRSYGDMIGFYPVPTTGQDGRPLHAKLLFINTDKANYLLVGSSNFTKKGYGFKNVTPNAEANLLIRVSNPNEKTLRLFIPSEIKAQKIEFIIPVDPEQKEAELKGAIPMIVENAEYKGGKLNVYITENIAPLKGSWEIWLKDRLILSSDIYKNKNPFAIEMKPEEMANTELSITVKCAEGEYLYPIIFYETKEIIEKQSKLEISTDTLYLFWMSKVLSPTLYSKTTGAEGTASPNGATIKLPETPDLLMSRMKKFVKALNGVKRFLAKDTIRNSTAMLENRIYGVFGVNRVFDIIKGIADDGTNIFCYSEMISVMEGLKNSYEDKNCLSVIGQYIDTLKRFIKPWGPTKEWRKYLILMEGANADTR